MSARWLLPICLLAALAAGCSRDPGTDTTGEGEVKGDKGLRYDSPQELATKAGVPLYPQAHVPNGKSSVTDSDQQTRYEIVMVSADAPDKVLKFYESKLQRAQRMASNKAVMGMSDKRSMVSVTAVPQGKQTEIRAVAIVEKGQPGR